MHGFRNIRIRRRPIACLVVLSGAVILAASVKAQASAETAILAEGWAALAKGDLSLAGSAAQRAVNTSPNSAAALAFAVEVDVVRNGPAAGLDTYERWLAAKRIDEAYVLRRVALAYVRAAAQNPLTRLEAVRTLSADGDPQAAAALAGGGPGEVSALASLGNERAVRSLVEQLRVPGGSKMGTINALVESKSTQAIPALLDLLADARPEHRAAAADGLGRLGARDAIPRLKPLLQDPAFPVRMSAASALYRLDDYSGVSQLEQLLASEHAAVRLGAAEAIAVRPTAAWQSVVRELTNAPDATVQLGAARLIAPYDRDLATSVLDRLGRSENPAVREEAGRIFVQRIAGDFKSLRKHLRSADALTVVRAASRILELTR